MRETRQSFLISFVKELGTRMSCSDAHCPNTAQGWATVLDPTDEKHASAARWIKGDSGRRYIELQSETALEYVVNHRESLGLTVTEGLMTLLQNTPAGMVIFLFYPGQQCFKPHIDREVMFSHQRGILQPYSRNPAISVFRPINEGRIHTRPLDFNEHFNEEADKINTARQRG